MRPRLFAGGGARSSGPSRAGRRVSSSSGLREEAEQAQSSEDLVRREACRRTRTILPATTTIERLCADALVDAERRIEARIAERVPPGLRRDVEHLLEETADAGVIRFVWLRQFEPGGNSDRLEHLGRLDVPEGLSSMHVSRPDRRDRLLLIRALAIAVLSLLGAAGECIGYAWGTYCAVPEICIAMRRVVVQHQVDVQLRRHLPFDQPQERQKLLVAVSLPALPDHLSSGDVQGGKQRRRAVART